jgi:hypothetical protein
MSNENGGGEKKCSREKEKMEEEWVLERREYEEREKEGWEGWRKRRTRERRNEKKSGGNREREGEDGRREIGNVKKGQENSLRMEELEKEGREVRSFTLLFLSRFC